MRSDHVPSTLALAHETLVHQRPSVDAAPQAWIAFHRHSADVYARTARVDSRHRHEASQWAAMEIRKAREIEHRLGIGVDDE
ncbi:AMED_5909 family protein [Actinophytocola glycyrrhizae]|uniref:AMED_5909 family protein n=1 Tax=Actinophytocola glycyrrhizae TaxID=2044873 RepID=A0ABV9RWD3_9PSEU